MNRSGLGELEAVAAVARVGGFRAAALELGLSATSVSNAVAALETRLGVRLFHRTTRSVSLSEAGENFLATIGPALSEIQGAMDAAASRRGRPAGRLRLSCSLGAARRVLVPVVLRFQKRYPEVQVDLLTDAQNIDIVARGFDAGIRVRGGVPADMTAIPFGDDLRFVVVGSPNYLRDHTAPRIPGDLTSHHCIRARWPSGAMSHWQFERANEAFSVDVPGSLTLDEPSLMREAALADAGLAYLWDAHVRDDLAKGRLVAVLNGWMPSAPGFCLYHPDRRQPAGPLRAFIDMLPKPTVRGRKAADRDDARR
jgi:DNA-binding transcriptional LysR family regulator